jgi:hypothetical protein
LGNLRNGRVLKAVLAKHFYGRVDDYLPFDSFLGHMGDERLKMSVAQIYFLSKNMSIFIFRKYKGLQK